MPAIPDTANIFDQIGVGRTLTPDENARTTLGQDSFLKLLTTQMENQDPTKPLDSAEFFGQLAQFSTVEGVQDLRSSFESLATSMRASQVLQASTLVGHQVLVSASNVAVEAGGRVQGQISLDSAADNVQINISDSAGRLVRSFPMGAQGRGEAPFIWDGADQEGEPVPSGDYNISVEVQQDGESRASRPFVWTQVDSVTLGEGTDHTLHVRGMGPVQLSDIKQIS